MTGLTHDTPNTQSDGPPASRGERDEYTHLVPLFAELAELATSGRGAGWTRVRDALVTGYLPVAQHIAWRYQGRGVPVEDLEQIATLGLINAIDRFNPERGAAFLGFAIPTITGEVRRYFRDHGWSVKLTRRLQELHLTVSAATRALDQELGRAPRPSEIAAWLGIPVDQVHEGLLASRAYQPDSMDRATGPGRDGRATMSVGDTIGDTDLALERLENAVSLQPELDRLPQRERLILALRFRGDLTQAEIGHRIGISQMHVSRLLHQTLDLLRDRLQGAV